MAILRPIIIIIIITTGRNLSAVEIDLVANDDERQVVGPARPGLYHEDVVPTVQLPERRRRGDVVDQDAAVGAAEVAGGQAVKPFLSRRVPYLMYVYIELVAKAAGAYRS